MKLTLPVLLALVTALTASETYQKPPKEVLEVLTARLPPALWASPSGTHVLIGNLHKYPSIGDVSQPFLGLAGLRVNPRINNPRVLTWFYGLRLKNLSSGQETLLVLPADAKLQEPRWSPDGKFFAIENVTENAVELFVGEAATGKVRKIAGVAMNGVLGQPVSWAGTANLLVRTVPANRGPAPPEPRVPTGPIVQESKGEAGPVRTIQDLLQNPYDESLFEYYGTSQLAFVDALSGKVTPVGKPGMFGSTTVSPDGKLILVQRITRPFSYLHSLYSFPREVEILDRSSGKSVATLAKLPLADNVPIGGVPTGRRNPKWFAGEPSTVVWTEALDDGDPRKKVPHRDRLLKFRAPFQAEPVEIVRFEQRITDWSAIEGSTQALVTDFDRDKRWIKTMLVDFGQPGTPAKLIWSRNQSDRYNDPGSPVIERSNSGQQVVSRSGDFIFLDGAGATPQGDRPFLDRFSLGTLKVERIHQSNSSEYETLIDVVSEDGSKFITRRESPTEPPNYYLRTAGGAATPITGYKDPTPQLRRIRKELVKYKRADGVDLSFTLYLPPDYKEGTRLPAVLYAYPTEFTDPNVAGQIAGSTQKFTSLSAYSHLFYVLAGYAVLDQTAFPMVGNPETVNNTYVEQLQMNAKAAIDKAAEMGVVDPNRVGAIGHSYGAFMTANLLAHTDLFKAGVARSGAYNRTLTPFGFQAERRTYWEAPETYLKMSPFNYAHRINEPLLLIHGQADDNSGTFPIQSERLYQAVRGNGGKVRLVMLPGEAHGYLAQESVQHTLYEMISWFDTYVKNAK